MKVELQAMDDQFSSLTSQMRRWMDQVLGPSYRQYAGGETWKPAVNVYEDDAAYHVLVDLAGVSREAIDLRVERGTLILVGQRPAPRPEAVEGLVQMHLMEIDHGTFCRRVDLPESVDVDQIAATYRSGLLRITLPKKTQP